MATEIATLPLVAGSDINDPDSAAGKVLAEMVSTLSKQEGYQRAFYGLQVENQSILDFLVDWDSIDAHKKFTNQPYYEPFVNTIMSILNGSARIVHAHFSPHPPSPAISNTTAPVTEIVAHYFDHAISDLDKTSFEEGVRKFVGVLEDHAEGFKGFAGGWIAEKVEHKDVEGGATVYQSMLGWQSVEAHMAFRETKKFQDNAYMMRPSYKKAVTMHHVAFKEG